MKHENAPPLVGGVYYRTPRSSDDPNQYCTIPAKDTLPLPDPVEGEPRPVRAFLAGVSLPRALPFNETGANGSTIAGTNLNGTVGSSPLPASLPHSQLNLQAMDANSQSIAEPRQITIPVSISEAAADVISKAKNGLAPSIIVGAISGPAINSDNIVINNNVSNSASNNVSITNNTTASHNIGNGDSNGNGGIGELSGAVSLSNGAINNTPKPVAASILPNLGSFASNLAIVQGNLNPNQLNSLPLEKLRTKVDNSYGTHGYHKIIRSPFNQVTYQFSKFHQPTWSNSYIITLGKELKLNDFAKSGLQRLDINNHYRIFRNSKTMNMITGSNGDEILQPDVVTDKKDRPIIWYRSPGVKVPKRILLSTEFSESLIKIKKRKIIEIDGNNEDIVNDIDDNEDSYHGDEVRNIGFNIRQGRLGHSAKYLAWKLAKINAITDA
ncbi:unnamed protein product [[Candida] boidinii]|nr:unnamed protein product [[Candida] boidinii]